MNHLNFLIFSVSFNPDFQKGKFNLFSHCVSTLGDPMINGNQNKEDLSKVQNKIHVCTARTNVSTALKTAVAETDPSSCEVPYRKVSDLILFIMIILLIAKLTINLVSRILL